MASETAELLRGVPLFSDLSQRELENIARTMRKRTFQAGDTIASEGTGGVGFFVIEGGEAVVTVGGEEVGRLGKGDYFGEIALIAETERTATVTAQSELRCYGITSWEFRPLVEGNASIAWKMLEAMAQKLRAAERRHH
jgi:CRP/FNR family transcriptional regulator, cyclic AMP receptor protein